MTNSGYTTEELFFVSASLRLVVLSLMSVSSSTTIGLESAYSGRMNARNMTEFVSYIQALGEENPRIVRQVRAESFSSR